MQINLHNVSSNQFTNYTENSVAINDQQYTNNILVTNNEITTCNIDNIKNITIKDLEPIIKYSPDLVIFGTSNQIIYPHIAVMEHLQNNNIGVEVMTIAALCRTFNFLVSEERKVACLIIF